jgi:hypothetical protein
MRDPLWRNSRYHLVFALTVAAIVAAVLAYVAHDQLGLSRADIRQDALTGASTIFAFLVMWSFIGGKAQH